MKWDEPLDPVYESYRSIYRRDRHRLMLAAYASYGLAAVFLVVNPWITLTLVLLGTAGLLTGEAMIHFRVVAAIEEDRNARTE